MVDNMKNKSFLNAIEITKDKVIDITFMLKSRMKSSYFTRSSAKMSFTSAIYFILRNITKTLQIEIDDFIEQYIGSGISMTKQAFSQLRQKIKPEAFIELNDTLINWFYDDEEFKKYRGYRLLSVDGSITEVPNTKEAWEYFGFHHNQSDRKNARAMVSVIYDIENDKILESNISNWKTAERDVAKEMIKSLEKKGFKNDLILFDRGYPSAEFISFLESKGLKYVIRVKNNKFSTLIDNANDNDQTVEMSYKKESLKIRVLNIELKTGEIEKLLTNVYDKDLSYKDFGCIYWKRWGIEVKYNELKSKYELENFSGITPIAIKQDFYSAIYLSNMVSLALSEANEKVKEEKKNLKYEYKINTTILIAKIRPILIKSLLAEKASKRARLYNKAMAQITKNIVPIRPDRSFPRKEPSRKNKYPTNRKRSM